MNILYLGIFSYHNVTDYIKTDDALRDRTKDGFKL